MRQFQAQEVLAYNNKYRCCYDYKRNNYNDVHNNKTILQYNYRQATSIRTCRGFKNKLVIYRYIGFLSW